MYPSKESPNPSKVFSLSQKSNGMKIKIILFLGIFFLSISHQPLTYHRENWQAGPSNRERGNKWLNTIYKSNLSTATDQFAAHKDFEFISREITYGFYLSDHSILTQLETELVTLCGLMIQNLPMETAWHLRGTRRIGVSMEDTELVQQCVSIELDFFFVGIS